MGGFALVAMTVGLAASLAESVRRRILRAPDHDDDTDELDAVFAEADAEFVEQAASLLSARLRPVVCRRVPVRAVRPAPVARTARVMFADGTVILARGKRRGDLGQLSVGLLMHRPVCLDSYRQDHHTTRLVFTLDTRQVRAVAVGLDQAD